jgi:hypothetical protein
VPYPCKWHFYYGVLPAGQSFRRFNTHTVKHKHFWDSWIHIPCSQTTFLKSVLTLPFHLRFRKKRTAFFWVVTQREVVIYYRRFGTIWRSHLQGARTVSLQSRVVSERFLRHDSQCSPVHTCLLQQHSTCVTPWSSAICRSRILAAVMKKYFSPFVETGSCSSGPYPESHAWIRKNSSNFFHILFNIILPSPVPRKKTMQRVGAEKRNGRNKWTTKKRT